MGQEMEINQEQEVTSSVGICFYVDSSHHTEYSNDTLRTHLRTNIVLQSFRNMGAERFKYIYLDVFLYHHERVSNKEKASSYLTYTSQTLKILSHLPISMWPFLEKGTSEKPITLISDFSGFDPVGFSSDARLKEFKLYHSHNIDTWVSLLKANKINTMMRDDN